jgi:hypothetical protein
MELCLHILMFVHLFGVANGGTTGNGVGSWGMNLGMLVYREYTAGVTVCVYP